MQSHEGEKESNINQTMSYGFVNRPSILSFKIDKLSPHGAFFTTGGRKYPREGLGGRGTAII